MLWRITHSPSILGCFPIGTITLQFSVDSKCRLFRHCQRSLCEMTGTSIWYALFCNALLCCFHGLFSRRILEGYEQCILSRVTVSVSTTLLYTCWRYCSQLYIWESPEFSLGKSLLMLRLYFRNFGYKYNWMKIFFFFCLGHLHTSCLIANTFWPLR